MYQRERNKKNTASKKMIRITIFFMALFGILLLNVFRIQFFMGDYWRKVADKQYSKGGEVVGERGKIMSSNGEDLAYNIPDYEVDIDPSALVDPGYVMSVLGKKLNLDTVKITAEANKLREGKKRYMKIAEHVSHDMKGQIEEELKRKDKFMDTGVFFYNSPRRFYPKKDFTAPVTGYVNVDGEGVFGIEKSCENFLKGERGYEKRYVSTYMVFDMPVDKNREVIEPQNGKNIILTIDSLMQYILDDELKKAFEENKPEWATGIIVDPNTGKILAMSSLPVENNALLKNKVISNAYEPGSVMKPVIMAMALNENLVNERERFYSEGQIKIKDRTIKDHDKSAVGMISPKEAIAKSSNVVMAQIGMRFDKNNYYDELKKFGFGEKTGVNLPGEIRGILKPLKRWDGLTPATTAFGQGISVTPMQITMAMAATINGGYLYTPIIVDKIVDDNGKIINESKPEMKRKVISEEVSFKVREMMRETVENGTGKPAQIDGYDIGGKTGTSQKAVNGIYMKGMYVASFAGFYPVEKPEYLCMIMIDNPSNGNYYGSSIAAPVFKNVMQRIIKYKNILPHNINTKTVYVSTPSAADVVSMKQSVELGEITEVPDMKGMNMREVLAVMNKHPKIELTVEGKGIVALQSPAAGTKIENVKRVHVLLEEPKRKGVEESTTKGGIGKKAGTATNGAIH